MLVAIKTGEQLSESVTGHGGSAVAPKPNKTYGVVVRGVRFIYDSEM